MIDRAKIRSNALSNIEAHQIMGHEPPLFALYLIDLLDALDAAERAQESCVRATVRHETATG